MTSKTQRTPPPSDQAPDGAAGAASRPRRRPYVPPRLEVLGDIREITLGATFGVGDSTPPNTQPF